MTLAARPVLIEHACARTVLRLFAAMDDRRNHDVTETFMPDGVWYRAGKALRGRAAILEAMNERPAHRVVRHVITNLIVDVVDEGAAVGRCLVTAYAGPAGEGPPAINGPWLLLTSTFRFAPAGDVWLVAEQRIERDFVFNGQVE